MQWLQCLPGENLINRSVEAFGNRLSVSRMFSICLENPTFQFIIYDYYLT